MIAGLTVFTFGQKVETRTVAGFTGIDASGSFNVTVARGAVESLSVEADEDVMQYVRSEVKNGVLCLYIDKSAPKTWWERLKNDNKRRIKASVVMNDLDRVSISGACNLTANDLFTPASFTATCRGASDMKVSVSVAGPVSIRASGASDIVIAANVTGDTEINLSGSSDIKGKLTGGKVKLSAKGSSDVHLTGSATDVFIDVSGASDFKGGNFTAQTATVKASGASDATVHVENSLNADVSGSSTVKYKGSPAVTVNSSGSSKVKKI
jgi:hypothetical protein